MATRLGSFTTGGHIATTRRIVPKTLRKVAVLAVVLASFCAAAQDADRALTGLPGFDFSPLPAPAKKELAQVLMDEFDYCGRPLTLFASLKKGDACKHTRRLVGWAAQQTAEGMPAQEILVELAKYNGSFTDKRAAFKVDPRQCVGPADAKVTLVEFSDFECPYCAMARPLLEALVKKKPFVRFCDVPFPLSGHPHSQLTGHAALFARDHGKFWQMHDALFDHQTSLNDDVVKGLANGMGLDGEALLKAYKEKRYEAELKANKAMGEAAGVDSTPSIFINGRKLALPVSAESLSLSVDDELDWHDGKSAWPSN